jgi:nitrite reductase/ring-hydroxylating ferredoxin subunit
MPMATPTQPEPPARRLDPASVGDGCTKNSAISRRTLLEKTVRLSTFGVMGPVFRRISSFAASRPKEVLVAKASSVPIGKAVTFRDPYREVAAYLVQPRKGSFAAFSRICPHRGCTVDFQASSNDFVCPCHGSVFSAKTGSVLRGPALRGLTVLELVEKNGDLYVES